MSFFDEVWQKTKDIAGAAEQKTADFVEHTRLKMKMSDTQREISSVLEGLGRLVYDAKKADEDVAPMIDDCIVKVDELELKLEALRLEADQFRNIIRCKGCGTVNECDSVFCKHCAGKLI